jgi:hypothetical protein
VQASHLHTPPVQTPSGQETPTQASSKVMRTSTRAFGVKAEMRSTRTILRAFVHQQRDVLGLDVAMDDACRVHCVEARENPRNQAHDLPQRERLSCIQPIRQGPPRQQLHHQVWQLVGRAEVEHIDDVAVPDGRSHARLSQEASAGHRRVPRQHEELHGHGSMDRDVLRAPDLRHAAATDLLDEPIAIVEHHAGRQGRERAPEGVRLDRFGHEGARITGTARRSSAVSGNWWSSRRVMTHDAFRA